MTDGLQAVFGQHQAHLLRLAAQYGNEIVPYLQNIERRVGEEFQRISMLKRKPSADTVQKRIMAIVDDELKGYLDDFKENSKKLAAYETSFTAQALSNATALQLDEPSAQAVIAAYRAAPVKLGQNRFRPFNKYLNDYYRTYKDRFEGVIIEAFVNGQTIDEIEREIMQAYRNTSTGKSDSIPDMARRSARTLARTGMTHVTNAARFEVGKANRDVVTGWVFNAVLDSRTSKQCSSLDGQEFSWEYKRLNQIRPELHPNCRSALTPQVAKKYRLSQNRPSKLTATGKPVSSSRGNYMEQLSRLSAKDQDAILGRTLGKAFRKMNPNDFAKQLLDSTMKPMTLEQLAKRESELGRIIKELTNG